MIIYVRTTHNGQPVSFFWGLKKVSKSTRAEDLVNALLAKYEKLIGLDESYLRERLVGFASDGARNLIGKNGVAARLKQSYPLILAFHCVAHWLQLVVLDSISVTPYFQEVEEVLRSIYAHYSRSPKNTEELKTIMAEMELDYLTPKSILKVRW